jgi:hypothetical protein
MSSALPSILSWASMSFVPDFWLMIRREKAQFSGTSHVPFCRIIPVRFTTIGLVTVALIHICTKGILCSGWIKPSQIAPSAQSSLTCMKSSSESFGDNVQGSRSRTIPSRLFGTRSGFLEADAWRSAEILRTLMNGNLYGWPWIHAENPAFLIALTLQMKLLI